MMAAAMDTPNTAPPSSFSNPLRFTLTAWCLGLILLGVIWRFVDLDYPRTFSFDEHHFVSNARNYIERKADWNDHPPLGKLVLVPAMKVFGDRGLGWRLSSVLFGLAMVGLGGLIAAKIFDDRRAGLIAAGLLAIDGFFISYARSALIDNPLTAFVYAALALMLWARSLTWFAAAALCVGMAVSCKWTGVCIFLVAPLLLWRARRSVWHVTWMFALASMVYLAIGAAALVITRQPIGLKAMLGTNWDLLKHHAGFTVWDNAASSKWYTWPLLIHPIVIFQERLAHGWIRAKSCIGNPLLWYATTACMLLALYGIGRAVFVRLRNRIAIDADIRRQAFVLVVMAALIAPFVVTHRQSYIFHYLGAYGIGLCLLASRLSRLERRAPLVALGFLACATAVSFFYLPLWTGAPLSPTGFELRLPFPSWR
jgi:dolichyl-phosphate-mannose--protein O-mannosyl transferase